MEKTGLSGISNDAMMLRDYSRILNKSEDKNGFLYRSRSIEKFQLESSKLVIDSV